MPCAGENAVSLRKDSQEELAEWATSIGLTPDQLASQMVRMALRQIAKAAAEACKPSNVFPLKP